MKAAVIGAGKLGTSIAEVLSGGGHDITLIDYDDNAVRKVQNNADIMTVKADGRMVSSLFSVKIEDYDVLVSVTDSDETNIFIASMAKKMGCPAVIARVRGPEHVDQLQFIRECFGIDYVASPDYTCAEEIFKFLSKRSGIETDHFEIDGAEIVECRINAMPSLIGKAVRDVSAELQGLLLAAVSRNGKILIPNGSTVLMENDSLYLLCAKENSTALHSRLDSAKKLLSFGVL